jgi:O-antigen ligase
MKRAIHLTLLVLFLSHVLLSTRPTEINAAVMLHLGSLGLLLGLLLAGSVAAPSGIRLHKFSLWITVFVLYFFSVGVITSLAGGVALRESIEFPYRISNLLIALLLPFWFTDEDDLRFLMRALFALVAVQTIRDLAVFAITNGRELLAERLAGAEYGSLFLLATPGCILGWTIAEWDRIRRRRWLQALLVTVVICVGLKTVLALSRTFWFAILPVNIALVLLILRRPAQRPVRHAVLGGLGLGMITVALLIAGSQSVRSNIMERIGLLGYSSQIKQDEFRAVLQQSQSSPLIGKGFGQEIEFQKGNLFKQQAHVHNIFLQFLLSSGLVGLGIVLWGALLIVHEAWLLERRGRHPLEVGAVVAVLLTLASFLIMGMVESVVRREHTYLILAVCITLLVSTKRVRMMNGFPARLGNDA